jgi:putative tryptophan/tyrosine transport system substrate-binding protein
MKNSRLEAFTVFAIWVAFCAIVQAQQPRKIPTIGYLSVLSPSSDSARIGGFRQSLAELGYVDGQNVTIQPRYAEGKLDRLPKLAGELVGLDVDVIVAGGSTAIRAVKNATKVIPIIMAHGSDPVELGYVASLARPGGNITGLTHLAPELGGKRLELLKDIVAKLSRVAVLTDPGAGGHAPQMKELVSAAPGLGLELRPIEIRSSTEVEKAFSVLKTERAGAFDRNTSTYVRSPSG